MSYNNNNQECKILDDNEIEAAEKEQFNFRRWKPEELEKKNSPFEKHSRREFPYLFQKKNIVPKEETKISLEEILTQVKELSLGPNTPRFLCKTPPEPPSVPIDDPPHFDLSMIQPIPYLKIDTIPVLDTIDLSNNEVLMKDGSTNV